MTRCPTRCNRCGETPCAAPWSETLTEWAMVPLAFGLGLVLFAYHAERELYERWGRRNRQCVRCTGPRS